MQITHNSCKLHLIFLEACNYNNFPMSEEFFIGFAHFPFFFFGQKKRGTTSKERLSLGQIYCYGLFGRIKCKAILGQK